MAFTQRDLDSIDRAIASGARSATIEGKSVTYHSLDEMLRIRSLIAEALKPADSPMRIRRVVRPVLS